MSKNILNLILLTHFTNFSTAHLASRQPTYSGDFRFSSDKGCFAIHMDHSHPQITALHFRENGKYSGNLEIQKEISGMVFAQSYSEGDQDITLEFSLKESSELTFVLHADIRSEGKLKLHIQSSQESRSQLHIVILQTSLGVSDITIESLIQGQESKVDIHSINIQKGSSSGEVKIIEKALVSNISGSILERAILLDEAHCILQGAPMIEKGARNANMSLEQKTLLMGKKARVISKPLLSVAHNEVQAQHSASVASLSPEDLFYLMSRGLSKEESKQLIMDAFIHELFTKIPSENVQNCLKENVRKFT